MTERTEWPKPDKARLKNAAIGLRDALIAFRDKNTHNTLAALCDEILASMAHEFALAIAGKVETPFDVAWRKVFGDQLCYDELINVYDEYLQAAWAGMEPDEFRSSPYSNRYLLPDATLSERGRPGVRPAANA